MEAAQEAPGHRASHRAPQERQPHGSVSLERPTGRQLARGAVCGGVQHPLVDADDGQEGGGLLVAPLFVPALGRQWRTLHALSTAWAFDWTGSALVTRLGLNKSGPTI